MCSIRLGSRGSRATTSGKTAATRLDDGVLTVREIADQLGHKRVSETLDTYLGRAQPSPKVANCST
jgi:hypothetical protein